MMRRICDTDAYAYAYDHAQGHAGSHASGHATDPGFTLKSCDGCEPAMRRGDAMR